MNYEYVVILRKAGERPVNLMSMLLCFASAVIFFRSGTPTNMIGYVSYIISALILAGLLFNIIAGLRGAGSISYRYLLLLTALGWLMVSRLEWVALIFGLLAFLEQQTKRPLEIGFDQNHIVINSLFRRRHDWSAFNNIVLKDGLLTLDFKNNRLLQREIADDEEEDADEEEFNAWCRDRLTAANLRGQNN